MTTKTSTPHVVRLLALACGFASAAVPAQDLFVDTPQGTRIPLQAKALAVDPALVDQNGGQVLRSMALLPQRVDLTPFQSPAKSQGGRDTCGTFGSVAALEAAYQRGWGLSLDLSEQYVNHWSQQFASAGTPRAVPNNETIAGSIGGGGLGRPLAAMLRGLSVPAESTLPYIGDGGYQNVDAGDQPSLNDWGRSYPQRDIDDFNLAQTPAVYVYSPPTAVTTTVMPQAALDAARYRPTGIRFLSAPEVNDVDAYRTILAAQHEIIMEFRCCDGHPGASSAPWLLPAGSNGGGAGHVMLIVGYDDATQMFRVKNSWGTGWGEGGYAWVGYDLVRRAATGAAYLDGVVSPQGPFDPWSHSHFFLGRWQLNLDGWKGVLDLYNLPQAWSIGAQRNYRIGTLFMADGRIHRVNGTISGNALSFWVDWATPDAPPSQLAGEQFTVRVFSRDHRAMAGTLRANTGATYAVELVKADSPVTGVARPGGLGVASYLGVWDFNHDGWRGRLEITSANTVTRRLRGRYVDANGTAYVLGGTVNPDARLFRLDIAFPTAQSFDGYLNGHERGVMAGTTVWGGMTFGFLGSRRR